MRPPGYGETQPRLDDDRLPVVLVVLDGLGDRPVPELGGRTPSEAADTPVLDALAARGASGWHLPFGWGRAPSSELAHWAMFGFADVPFPGRAVLEALGAGVDVPTGVAVTHAALRTARTDEAGRVWITGRVGPDDTDDASRLLDDLAELARRHDAHLTPLPRRGEALLALNGHASGAVTDSDPFFEDRHPWLRVLALRRCPRGRADGRGPGGAAARRPRRPARPPRQPRPRRPRSPGAGGAHDEVVGRAVADPVVHGAERRRRRRGDQHRALPGPRLRARDGVSARATLRRRRRPISGPA